MVVMGVVYSSVADFRLLDLRSHPILTLNTSNNFIEFGLGLTCLHNKLFCVLTSAWPGKLYVLAFDLKFERHLDLLRATFPLHLNILHGCIYDL